MSRVARRAVAQNRPGAIDTELGRDERAIGTIVVAENWICSSSRLVGEAAKAREVSSSTETAIFFTGSAYQSCLAHADCLAKRLAACHNDN